MSKGISKEVIFKEAEKILKRKGVAKLSLRELADSLNIKPASLYNHITGVNDIYEHLCSVASKKLKEQLKTAMEGKSPDDAFIAGGKAYYRFAEKNHELYGVLIKSRSSSYKTIKRSAAESFEPMRELIQSYGLDKESQLHFVRIFRSFIHGFVEIAHNGFMQKGSLPREATYEMALNGFLSMLHERGMKND